MSILARLLGRLRSVAWMIRVRLTLWYVALLAVILVAFSAFLYISLSRSLYQEIDDSLETEVQQIDKALDDNQPSFDEAIDRVPADMLAALYDPRSKTVLATRPRAGLLPDPSGLAGAAAGHRSLQTIALPDGRAARLLTVPIVHDKRVVVLLQIARSEREVEVALRQLLFLMALAGPLTLGLAVVGGLFLASRALGPIDRITNAAERIGADDLSQRLNFQGPSDEVGRLAATFDRMLARLEQAFQRQRQFTADASHELRTPLAMLTSQADVALERNRTPAQYREVLASMREDAARMSELLSQMLLLARADAGEAPLNLEVLALDDLAADVVAAMQALAENHAVGLHLAPLPPHGPITVEGDQTRLTQLLVNLIDNGLKYTPSGGTVTVALRLEASSAVLAVTDTGIGIAPEHLPGIFERFYRVEQARSRAAGGTGLGLAISRWIVRAHGGDIRVASEPGMGTTISVGLPLAPAGPRGNGSPAAQHRLPSALATRTLRSAPPDRRPE